MSNNIEYPTYKGGLNIKGLNAKDEEVALKMTNQMPVAIELNKKNKIVLVTEAFTGWLSSDKLSQSYNISMAYSNKTKIKVNKNGQIKEIEKYWLDINDKLNQKIYDSEQEVFDNQGLSLVEEGPINVKNYMFTGAAPYIQQMTSGETILSYNKYFQNEDGTWQNYPTLRIGNEDADFTDSTEFKYDKDTDFGYGFESISTLSSHCLALTAAGNKEVNGTQKHYIGIYPMYLNHTITAKPLSEMSEDNTDALFIGSESQAQATIQVANDKDNIYFLINRLDNSITDKDTTELYVSSGEENDNYYKFVMNADKIVEMKQKIGENETKIDTKEIKSDINKNDTNDKNGGYKVLLSIPKEKFGQEVNMLRLDAVVNNQDNGEETVISDTFTNSKVNDISTWNKVKIANIKSIEIKSLPIKMEYIQNYEKLDLTGAKLKINYNNIDAEEIEITSEMVSGFDNSKTGTQTIIVEYKGYKTEFNIVVNPKKATNVVLKNVPQKQEYIQNYEKLDTIGGSIEIEYNDKSKEIRPITPEMVSGFDNSKIGKQILTVTCEEMKVKYEINIVQKQVETIKINKMPGKVTYIQNYDLLDISGGTIEIEYNDKSRSILEITPEMISGFDNTKIGKQLLTITYEGKTTEYEINIVEKDIVEIKMKTLPKKKEYIQNYEKIDLNGGTIEVIYNDKTNEEVKILEKMIKGFDNSKLGTQTIIVKYGEYETEFDIKVIAKSVEKIKIVKIPEKIEYIKDKEDIELNGGIIKIYYNDQSEDEKEITKEMITGFDNKIVGIVQIVVKYENCVDTYNVKIIPEENSDKNIEEDKKTGDKTVATTIIPNAGKSKTILCFIIILCIIIVIVAYKKNKYKDIK